MKKRRLSSEMAYVFGLIFVALGCSLMEQSDYGVSMIVAPAYVIYRKVSLTLPWFTFGMAEYLTQGIVLLLMMAILRHGQLSYLLSFATAVIYGVILDIILPVVRLIPCETTLLRVLFFGFGMLFCSAGVSMMFHTYLSPEVYELFVKEFARFFHKDITHVKTCYDVFSTLLAVVLSFWLFGFGTFIGVKVGTIYCAIINGLLIGQFSKLYEKLFEFYDRFPWRGFFLK